MLALVIVLPLLLAQAQGPPAAGGSTPPGPAVPAPPPAGNSGQDYRIGPGDILRVTVYAYADLNQIVVVQPGGAFVFPLIGPVPAAQATPAEVEKRVAEKLSNDTVFVPQAARIFVSGQVRSPGAFTFTPGLTVRQAVSLAGGPHTRGKLGRPPDRARSWKKSRTFKVELDASLEAGDTVVPKARWF